MNDIIELEFSSLHPAYNDMRKSLKRGETYRINAGDGIITYSYNAVCVYKREFKKQKTVVKFKVLDNEKNILL